MKRSLGVTLSAVAAGLGSGLLALLGTIAVVSTYLVPPPPTPGMPPIFMQVVLVVGCLILLGLAGWGMATAAGLFRLKTWARWSMLTFCALWTLFTLAAALMISVIPLPPTPGLPADAVGSIKIFVGVFYGLQAILGGVWLFYFNRPSVRAQFGGGGAPGPGPGGRPLSISIIAWLLIVGGVSTILFSILPFPATVLGMVFTGWAGRLFYLGYSVISITAGVGMLRLRPASRIAAIVIFIHAILNSLLMVALPGLPERLAAVYAGFPGLQPSQMSLAAAVPSILMGMVFSAIPLWFLVVRRAAFDPPVAGPGGLEPLLPPPLPPLE